MPQARMKRSARSISAGDRLVAPALGARGDELLVPGVHLREVGEAALGEGAQQVERRRRLVVGARPGASGSGTAGVGDRSVVVDDVAAERRHLDVADALGGDGAGLGELPGDAADLHDRHAGAVGEDDRHLQDDLQLVPDRVGGEVGERLGAVARLEQEGLARRPRRPRARVRRRASPANTSGGSVDSRASAFFDRRVGPVRLLCGGELRRDAALQGADWGGSSPEQVTP